MSYWDACIAHAAHQGLGPPALLLNFAGYDVDLWQSGGFTMLLTITVDDAHEVWVNCEDEGVYSVGFYNITEDDRDMLSYADCGLNELPDAIDRLVAQG